MFERFTEEGREVVVLAQDEARRLNHCYTGTEHILLGLVRLEESPAADVLASFGLTLERARADLVQIVARGDEETVGQIPFTPRAKKVLELSLREALSLGHDWIGPEHILLGILHEGGGVAARLLSDAGADRDKVRVMAVNALDAAPRPRVARVPRLGHQGVVATWLARVHPGLERLDQEIRDELGRDGDDGDLLLVLACTPGLLSGRALAELGVDRDALWGVLERLRRERIDAAAEVERQRQEVCQAKEAAIEGGDFPEAARLRDRERSSRSVNEPELRR